jgi:molecular chaperone GrpE
LRQNIDMRGSQKVFPGNDFMTDTAANNNQAADAETAAAPATDPAQEAASLAKEVVELKDRVLRTLAEMENLRRRTEREIADSRTYAITGFARDLVGVSDNIRRALDAVGDSGIVLEGAAKALVDGVELTERDLIKVLEKNGVRKFDPHGAKFDPNLHQAMFEVPDANVPSGSVVQVVQPGYMLADRVLRPALVGVSKGGPRVAPTPTESGAAAGGAGE